jgi:hypothetical protein
VGSVNRLVEALIARPQVIEQAAGAQDPGFGLLLDALGDALFSESELYRIQNDPQLRQRLEKSYLPTISAPDWEHALSLTENRTASSSGWWTVMVAGSSGRFGLTVPQDGSRAELVALFTGPANSTWVLVYDPALGTVSDVSGAPHCGAPSRGICDKQNCSGCDSAEVYDETTQSIAIKCVCPHQAE